MTIPQIEAERKHRESLNNHSLADILFLNFALIGGILSLLAIASFF